jgi:hypothetical protein
MPVILIGTYKAGQSEWYNKRIPPPVFSGNDDHAYFFAVYLVRTVCRDRTSRAEQ